MQNKSPLFRLNTHDLIQGLYIILISAALTSFYDLFNQSGFDITFADLKAAAKTTIIAGMAYLIKNLAQGPRKSTNKRKTDQNEG